VVSTEDFIDDYLAHFTDVLAADGLHQNIESAKAEIAAVVERGGKLMFAGNGASASIASHYALDFTKQAKVPSIAFNDAALLTAYANDYGYEHWVARAIRHHGRLGDLAVLISTSGRSPNIVNAASECRSLGIPVISFTGFAPDNPVCSGADINFWADSRAYNVVEGVHAAWLGMVCDAIIGKREYNVTD
jgi:D-sedoheptulose 7-phosphate isomerase